MIRRDEVYKIASWENLMVWKGEITFAITDDVFDPLEMPSTWYSTSMASLCLSI